jgi:hypothetical protein
VIGNHESLRLPNKTLDLRSFESEKVPLGKRALILKAINSIKPRRLADFARRDSALSRTRQNNGSRIEKKR